MEKQEKRATKPSAASRGPLRLAWPGGSNSSSGSGSGNRKGQSSIGRPATLVSSSSSSSSQSSRRKRQRRATETSSTMLWVDKYAPVSTAQLCVAPKKVKEIRAWMTIPSRQGGGSSLSFSCSRLLVFVGSPGIGKSTTIRLLASELGWTVHEWSDSYSNPHYLQASGRGGGILESVDRTNSLESFEEFLQRAGAGFSPLEVTTTGLDKATTANNGKSIILIDELPNLRNLETEQEFREIMNRHIEQSHISTVLIFSDVQEGKHQPRDLERLVDPQYLYSEATTILQCNPVTKARMKKSLEAICKKESIQVPAQFWEEVHMQSGGDLRHAIMALQFRGSGNNVAQRGSDDCGKKHFERDAKLSMFHTLGKVLYAKRKKVSDDALSHGPNNRRPPLDFDPDIVLEESGMELGGALTFLGYHSPDFFTDMTDISRAFDHYSDAAVLLGRSTRRDYSDSVFPTGYVGSIAGRAVADANRHPAPRSFRPLSAPKIFEVLRNQRANEVTMEQLCKRLSVGSDRMPLDVNLGKARTFVTDHLPFMRTIAPGDVDSALNNLFSYVRSNDNIETTPQSKHVAQFEEQERILEEDDIVDDDDDSSLEDDEVVLQRGESATKRMKLSFPAKMAPREVSLSPQEIVIIDE